MKSNENIAEIGIILYSDCLLSGVQGMTDLFRLANMILNQHEGIKRPIIRVSHWQYKNNKIECIFDTHPGTPNKLMMIIAPPSLISPEDAQSPPAVSKWPAENHQNGSVMCSVCAGSFVLAKAGVLKNRRATTHWMFADEMSEKFPDVQVDTDKMIIDDGDIITAGGIMAWTDLGLRMVQRIQGPTIMMETARFLLVDPPGREQRYYAVFSPELQHGDLAILKVQHWLQKNGARDVSLADMSKVAGMEERTFLRRFQKATGTKPTEYCQQVRVSKAREMLELTNQNVEQIAWSVGYEDPGAFRKVFHKIMGLTPGDYRHRFGITSKAA